MKAILYSTHQPERTAFDQINNANAQDLAYVSARLETTTIPGSQARTHGKLGCRNLDGPGSARRECSEGRSSVGLTHGYKLNVETKFRCFAVFLLSFLQVIRGACQEAPASPDRPWHASEESKFASDANSQREAVTPIDPAKTYTLAELIDFAETQNPETRAAWDRARSQAAALGIARSELYPALAATALAQIDRWDAFSGTFHPQTESDLEGRLNLTYTIFDFGARAGRISDAKAQVLAANFVFNDAHRRVIFGVELAYYPLLNGAGPIHSAENNLTNALTVQQAAEDRLQNGLATLPDVLESRSAAAQAEYELQAVSGAKAIARGDLAKALGTVPTFSIRVQPLDQLAMPDSIAETAEQALDRAFAQRHDLMRQLAEPRSANAQVKEARGAYYPIFGLTGSAAGQSFHALEEGYTWVHTRDVAEGAGLSLTLPMFDGGLRRSKLARAKADVQAGFRYGNSPNLRGMPPGCGPQWLLKFVSQPQFATRWQACPG
jgi:outer membrane protein